MMTGHVSRAQLEGALLEAKAESAQLQLDRDDMLAQAQRRQGSADPSVLSRYREGFSDGTQANSLPAHR